MNDIASSSSPGLVLWHGAHRWDGRAEVRPPRKGCYECGPGLYLTTHASTARKYAKGGGSVMRVTLDPALRWLEDIQVSLSTIESFIKASGLRRKAKLLDDVRWSQEKSGHPTDLPLAHLVNLCVNHEASAGKAGVELAQFLVSCGADASHHQASGQEEWVIVFNPAVVRRVQKVPAAEQTLADEVCPSIREQYSGSSPSPRRPRGP